MGTALRTEWRKTTTTRMWWILLLVMVAYVAVIGAFIALAFTAAESPQAGAQAAVTLEDADTVLALYSIALPIAYVFPLVVGVLSVTTEFRHQTLTPTLLGEPRRGRVVGAKLVVSLLLGLVFGAVGLATGVGVTVPFVLATDGAATGLDDAGTWQSLGQAALAMALWAGIGVGLGALLRNQVAAIVAALAFSQLIEPFARFGLAAFDATAEVAKYLPGAAGDAMAGASLLAVGGDDALLLWWQGGLVLAGYAVVLTGLGVLGVLRRDVA